MAPMATRWLFQVFCFAPMASMNPVPSSSTSSTQVYQGSDTSFSMIGDTAGASASAASVSVAASTVSAASVAASVVASTASASAGVASISASISANSIASIFLITVFLLCFAGAQAQKQTRMRLCARGKRMPA